MEKKLESVLKKSVRRHMVSDVEVGTFLSGGVDSGFIAVLSGAKMAFTVGFLDGNSGYNEENRAREGGPVCASFLSHAYYREKGVLGMCFQR